MKVHSVSHHVPHIVDIHEIIILSLDVFGQATPSADPSGSEADRVDH